MADRERILLEIGNSTVKLARVGGGGSIAVERYADPEEAIRLCLNSDAEIICAPVRRELSGAMLAELEATGRFRRIEQSHLARFIGDSYDTPETLGLDRALNLAGLGGDGIAISCGTAITVDAIIGGGPLWGAIMPGFRTAAEGLHNRVPVLPLVAPEDPTSLPARTSLESVANGVLLGAAWGVEGIAGTLAGIAFAGAVPRIVITGGDGPILLRLWKGLPQPELDDTLLFRGMMRIFDFRFPISD